MGSGRSVIAIDGPVASGKSVVGRELARRLGFRYLDTGLMYRAITWLALHCATPIGDSAKLGDLAHSHEIRLHGQDSDQVLVSGHELGPELREAQVEETVSLVARVPQVRRALVQQQRRMARDGMIVMAGRDIGTVVVPDASLKIFLSASTEERARRRWQDLLDQGQDVSLQQVLQDTRARDEIDSTRADSPLRPAHDALTLDTGLLSIEQVVQRILQRVNPSR